MPPDAGAASARKEGPPQDADRRDGRGGGLYVTVSRKRLDYDRPLLQPGANSNSPPAWTPARMIGLGQFRALALLTTTPCDTTARTEAFRQPRRPVSEGREAVAAEPGGEGPDDQLDGMLDAIAADVMGRAALICAGISTDYANRIRIARRSLPRDQVEAAIDALRQAKKAAVKFVRESAALEAKGMQDRARVMFRRSRIRLVTEVYKPST